MAAGDTRAAGAHLLICGRTKQTLRLFHLWFSTLSNYAQASSCSATISPSCGRSRSSRCCRLLRATAFCAGVDLTVHVSDFDAHVQAIRDASGSLYSFAPDAVLLAVQTRDIGPDLWSYFTSLTSEGTRASIARVTNEFQAWIRAFRQRSAAHLIVHDLEKPAVPLARLLDAQSNSGQSATILEINRSLATLAPNRREFTFSTTMAWSPITDARPGTTNANG